MPTAGARGRARTPAQWRQERTGANLNNIICTDRPRRILGALQSRKLLQSVAPTLRGTVWEKKELTLASGSAVSACPENVGEMFGFASSASGFKYVTVDGRANLQDQCGRRLQLVTEMVNK